jgi:Glycosyl hydrolase family 20, catalytic domain/Glycosyl hydrolase family 20, domain 2
VNIIPRTNWIHGVILAGFSGVVYSAEPVRLPLIPYPKQVELQQATFTPMQELVVVYDGNGKDNPIGDTLAQDLAATGFSATHQKEMPGHQASAIHLKLDANPNSKDESYDLQIADHVSITARSVDGLFWGTRTLLQLLHAGPGKSIPCLTMKDQPDFGYRGLMIDNARKFHSINFHIETIKRLASFKMNRYQIHFSDHQSYTLPSSVFPGLPTQGRSLSVMDVKRLVEVATRYHVQIVPEIDVPGHASALILGISGLGCDGDRRKICIGRDSTYESLEKLFSEVMEMIPGDYWHLGSDEVSYAKTRCAGCVARMQSESFKESSQLFHYFINRMNGFLKSKGRQVLVWEGFSPMAEPIISRDIIVCPFDVKHDEKTPIDYLNAGYRLLNTSWSPLYVADNTSMTTPEDLALWSPYMFGAGRSPQPFGYWKKFRQEEYRDKILGAQMCSWDNEEKAENGLLFGKGPGFPDYGRPGPRVQIVAERVWTGTSTTPKDLLERAGASYW